MRAGLVLSATTLLLVQFGIGEVVVFAQAAHPAAASNAPTQKLPNVQGVGTAGVIPVWTGPATLADSHIQSGAAVTINVPLNVSGTVTMDNGLNVSGFTKIDGGGGNIAVAGQGGIGISGQGTNLGVLAIGEIGVSGTGTNGPGVQGTGTNGAGVQGTGALYPGVWGTSTSGPGVYGASTTLHGVSGEATAASGSGVFGINDDQETGGIGVTGKASGPSGIGVYGNGPKFGVFGQGASGIGVQGSSDTNAGVFGFSQSGHGVFGQSSFIGVSGQSDVGIGVTAIAQGVKPALFAANTVGKAAQFNGDLEVQGDATKPGGGAWSVLSDARTKKFVEPIDNALGQLLKLRGVTYEYTNPSAFHELPGRHLGMVAQDVEQVFPSWVDPGRDGYKRLTFRGFEAVAVEAIRELNAHVTANATETTARIAELEQQNAELRHSIEVLSEMVKALQRQ